MYPTHLSLLSYDLVGLIYYLSSKNDFLTAEKLFKVKNSFKGMMGIFDIKNNLSNLNKLFKKKNSFKGKIGIFDIKNNKINHQLNFYKIEDKKLTKIF